MCDECACACAWPACVCVVALSCGTLERAGALSVANGSGSRYLDGLPAERCRLGEELANPGSNPNA